MYCQSLKRWRRHWGTINKLNAKVVSACSKAYQSLDKLGTNTDRADRFDVMVEANRIRSRCLGQVNKSAILQVLEAPLLTLVGGEKLRGSLQNLVDEVKANK